MKKIKQFVKNVKLRWYELMICICDSGFEQAKIDSNEKAMATWDKRYIKYLAKKDSVVSGK